MFENQINLVFIGVFTFLDVKPTSMQILFHSWQLLPNFFGQVMHFCKSIWANLIDTYFKFLQTLSLVVAYWKKHDQNRFLESFIPNLKF